MSVEDRRQYILEIAKKHFPHKVPNPGQLETVVEAVRHFESGKKHVVVQAPTGIGKTAIATTVHRVMRALNSKHRTTIITATKGLQDQYTDSDKLVYDLKGKTNYPCPHDKGPYNSGACRAHVGRGGCVKQVSCAYVKRRIVWCNVAELRLTNNSFQIEACPSICMKEENVADLIIADECHDLDDHIVDHTTIRLRSKDYINLARYGYGEFVKDMENYIDVFKNKLIGVPFNISDQEYDGMAALNVKLVRMQADFESMLADKSRKDHEEVGDILEQLQQITDKTEILDDAVGGEWIIDEFESKQYVSIKPVFAWQVSNYAMFRKAKYFLHMSATICGFEEYAGTLGIKPEDCEFLDIPNPIPVQNRKVFAIANQKVSGSFDVQKLTADIDKLITLNKGKNGIIHTVSYALANQIYLNSIHRDNMLVSKDRMEIVQELSKHDTGRIVLSASIEKGFDAKDGMCRFQIIPKVPYGYLGDPLVKLNSERRPAWYARRAILRIVQACGRSTRGVNDYSTVYILDSNFRRLLKDNMDIFPGWFLESLVVK